MSLEDTIKELCEKLDINNDLLRETIALRNEAKALITESAGAASSSRRTRAAKDDDDKPASRRAAKDDDDKPASRRAAKDDDDKPASRRSGKDEDDGGTDETVSHKTVSERVADYMGAQDSKGYTARRDAVRDLIADNGFDKLRDIAPDADDDSAAKRKKEKALVGILAGVNKLIAKAKSADDDADV